MNAQEEFLEFNKWVLTGSNVTVRIDNFAVNWGNVVADAPVADAYFSEDLLDHFEQAKPLALGSSEGITYYVCQNYPVADVPPALRLIDMTHEKN